MTCIAIGNIVMCISIIVKKIRHRQRYKAVAIDFVICPQKNKANITYNKATVKNKANIRQFWGVVKIRQTARNTPVYCRVIHA